MTYNEDDTNEDDFMKSSEDDLYLTVFKTY